MKYQKAEVVPISDCFHSRTRSIGTFWRVHLPPGERTAAAPSVVPSYSASTLLPVTTGGANCRLVRVNPANHRGNRMVQRPTEIRQLVHGRRLLAGGIKSARHKTIAFGPPQRFGKHLVRHIIDGALHLLVTQIPVSKFR